MKHEEFLGKLNEVRKSRKGQWQAQCPAHDDSNPSLQVGTGPGGRILIHCHGGCSAQAVLSAMGLTMKDLYDNARRNIERGSGPNPERPGRGGWQTVEAAVSHYVQSLGATFGGNWEYPGGSFRMLRFNLPDGGKSFRPIHREGQIWRAGDPRGRLPLYRADGLPAEGLVLATEGEKCADAVAAYVSCDVLDSPLCSPGCALFPFRHGGRPRPTDTPPVPTMPVESKENQE